MRSEHFEGIGLSAWMINFIEQWDLNLKEVGATSKTTIFFEEKNGGFFRYGRRSRPCTSINFENIKFLLWGYADFLEISTYVPA